MFARSISLHHRHCLARPAAQRHLVQVRAEAASVPDARRLLTTKGWHRAWVDGVTERISRNQLNVSVEDLSKTLDFLESTGLSPEKAEHMAALAWGLLSRTPDQMSKVVEYLKSRGITDVADALFQYPKLLEYDVSPDGKELVKGEKSRVKVDVLQEDGAQKVLVNFYRVGTAFKASPISPWKPLDS